MSRQVSLSAFEAGADLSVLTDRQREVWSAFHREGGVRPAARDLDVNPGTVYQHIERARAKLRRAGEV